MKVRTIGFKRKKSHRGRISAINQQQLDEYVKGFEDELYRKTCEAVRDYANSVRSVFGGQQHRPTSRTEDVPERQRRADIAIAQRVELFKRDRD
jgi:hypothetical protein